MRFLVTCLLLVPFSLLACGSDGGATGGETGVEDADSDVSTDSDAEESGQEPDGETGEDVNSDADGVESDGSGSGEETGGEDCTDEDWDGYGEGCVAGPDCDDSDEALHQILSAYLDADGDGYGVGDLQEVCSGDVLSASYALVSAGEDCDDSDETRWLESTVWADADGDGWTSSEPVVICQGAELPSGYLSEPHGEDCNDGADTAWALVPGWADADGDGHAVGESLEFCIGEALPEGWLPEAPEVADCNDDDAEVWDFIQGFPDLDGDGYGSAVSFPACSGETLVAGYSNDGTDCDDGDPDKWQYLEGQQDKDLDGYGAGGTVVACSGETLAVGFSNEPAIDCDDSNPAVWAFMVGWVDSDGDGHGAGEAVQICGGDDVPKGYSLNASDCAPDDSSSWTLMDVHVDGDGDGFGALNSEAVQECVGESAPPGTSFESSDCDDSESAYWMNAAVSEDGDGDGHGVGESVEACVGVVAPPGWALNSAGPDCNDGDAQHWFDCLTCIDQDRDGYGEGCDLGADCDDLSVVSRPGGVEIPDDGVDNDCAGDGDATRSDATGIFVDLALGNDGNEGTMAAPMQTLSAAIPAATAAGKSVFVAAGFQATQNLNVTADVHGGYAVPGWTRDLSVPVYTHFEAVDIFLLTVTQSSDVVLSGLMLSGQDTSVLSYMLYNLGASTLVHMSILGGDASSVTGIHNAGELKVHDSNVNGGFGDVECVGIYNAPEAIAELSDAMVNSGFCTGTGAMETGINNVGTLTFTGSSLNGGIAKGHAYGLKHGADATTFVARSFIDASDSTVGSSFAVMASGDRLELRNNVLTGGTVPPGQPSWVVSLAGPGEQAHVLVNNVIRVGGGDIGGGIRLKTGESALLNNIVVAGSASPLPGIVCVAGVGGGSGSAHLHGNDVHVDGPLWSEGVDLIDDAEALNACALSCCLSASANVSVPPVFVPESEWELGEASPCIGAGMDPSPWVTSLFTDLAGDVHPGPSNQWNIGADATN